MKPAVKVYDLESGPSFAVLKQRLPQHDAGQINGPAEINKLQDACGKAGPQLYRFEELNVVANPVGVRFAVPPRDFAVLVGE